MLGEIFMKRFKELVSKYKLSGMLIALFLSVSLFVGGAFFLNTTNSIAKSRQLAQQAANVDTNINDNAEAWYTLPQIVFDAGFTTTGFYWSSIVGNDVSAQHFIKVDMKGYGSPIPTYNAGTDARGAYYEFNGSNYFLSTQRFSGSGSICGSFEKTTNWSLICAIQTPSTITTNTQTIFSNAESGGLGLYINNGYFCAEVGTARGKTYDYYHAYSRHYLSPSTFYVVTMRYSGNKLYLFVNDDQNGVEVNVTINKPPRAVPPAFPASRRRSSGRSADSSTRARSAPPSGCRRSRRAAQARRRSGRSCAR